MQRHRLSRLSDSHHERNRSSDQILLHPKKVGTLPLSDQKVKRTNEIKTAIPLLDAIDIQGKDVTADALLTQRKIADYLVLERHAHYHFTVKKNQPELFKDIVLYFEDRKNPDFVQCDSPDHGRIEVRKIWTTTELNDYLNFPHVGQAFAIQREFTDKKTGEHSCEIAYGITSRTPEQADAQRILATNRGHWSIENSCHYITIGTMMKTVAAYVLVMARKTSLDCGDSPSASSNLKAFATLRKKCGSFFAIYAWSLTTCA